MEEVEKKYNQIFHPINSILKSPLPSIVSKEKSESAINLCFSVPWENLMNKQTLSLLVESLLHHYHLGIHHIFLSIRLYSLSTNEDDYNDRLLYLQALKPFLQKQQLTIFFISAPIPSTKNAPTPSEANSQALASQMMHHFEFLQQYTMTLALLLSRGQGVHLLSYWKTHQLLILPPLFDPLQWKEYHTHHQRHHNESNIKKNADKFEQGVKIGFDGIEMDANKVSDVIGKKSTTIEEFMDKIIKLSKKEKGENSQEEEKYYFLHSLPIPSRELTNHLLFLQNEGKGRGGVGSNSNNANTNKQFLGDIYQLSPNYYHYYFHYYSKRFFNNHYNNNYANYLNNFLYDHYHNNLIQDDPTMPSFDFGFILHLPSIPPSTSTSSKENKVGGGLISSSTSPFLQFLWYNYLPTSYKGKKLNKNFLLRINTNIIHFTIAELYSYYDYQNIYNLQQILVKNLNNPLQSMNLNNNNQKNDRRRVRLLRRKLQTIEELTIKDQHDHNLINDLLLVNGNELLRNAEEEAANEFAEEEKQRMNGRTNNNNDGNGNGFQEFFSNLVSKIRKSDSSPSDIEKELSSIQSNPHGRDEIEEDPVATSSSTTVTTSTNNNNNKGRTNSFQTIFSYYQRKDQSFTNKLFFIYFLNVHSLPLPINTTENINQRYEIVIERDHEKNQLIMKQRAEIIEGYDTSMYYEEFVKNKVDINTFLMEEVSHDLNHQKEGEEERKNGRSNKEEDMKTIRDHRTLEEYYQLLQRNIYSYEYYPSLLFESSSSSSLNLLKENYDILFQQNPIQKIMMSKEEKQRKNKAMKISSSSSFNSHFPDFLTVYKTRFSHE